jgi:hypothetical protein
MDGKNRAEYSRSKRIPQCEGALCGIILALVLDETPWGITDTQGPQVLVEAGGGARLAGVWAPVQTLLKWVQRIRARVVDLCGGCHG